jgi:hypothetical protein
VKSAKNHFSDFATYQALATKYDKLCSAMSKNLTIPVILLCTLVLVAAANFLRGRNNQTLEGVVVMDYPAYKFYSGQKDCHLDGTAYWLVPNDRFHDIVPCPALPI